MIKQIKQRRGSFFAVLLVASAACAQYQYPHGTPRTFEEYKDYPQIRGETQTLTEHELPSWMTLDGEIRSRTEDQSAINLLPGQDKFYELERVRGGMEIRPTSWLTAYAQFHDLHALGLPLKYTPPTCETPSTSGRHTWSSTTN